MFIKSSRAVLRREAIPDLQGREGERVWWLCSLQSGQGDRGRGERRKQVRGGKGGAQLPDSWHHQLFLGNHFSRSSHWLLDLMNRAGN